MKLFLCIAMTLIVSVMIAHTSLAQLQDEDVTYTPPSPEASSLLEYANIPVNLHSGTPEIVIPLFTLKGRVSEVPFSISYHASGIKVKDISSNLGLGWAFNGGGVITRIVRAQPDESSNGYLNRTFNTTLNASPTIINLSKVFDGTYDTEPDMFFYNFQGFTGKFLLDEDGVPLQLPEKDIKIIPPDFSSPNPTWEITDLSGIRYVFGKTSSSREVTESKLTREPAEKLKVFISSWYLSEIIYPTGNEIVTFSYSPGSDAYYEYSNQMSGVVQPTALTFNCGPNGPFNVYALPAFPVKTQKTQVTVKSVKYLSTVNSSLGTVTVSYALNREDLLNARRITSVVLKNNASEEIQKFDFINNSYFVSDGCTTDKCKRLKLVAIRQTTNNANIPYKSFSYNVDVNLPTRESVATDHYGFYNNNTLTHGIPAITDRFGNYYGGADKSPDLAKTCANILTKITHATGGFDEMFYELHTEYEGAANVNVGGLRITKLDKDEGNGVKVSRIFSYKQVANPSRSSGKRYRKAKYYYESSMSLYGQCPTSNPPGNTVIPYGNNLIVRYSIPLVDLFDLGGQHVGYSEVQVTNNDNSREEYAFHSFNDRADDQAQIRAHESWRIAETGQDGPPFVALGDRSYERGLMREQIIYGGDGKKKSKTTFVYDFYQASTREVPIGKALWVSFSYSNAGYVWGISNYKHRGVRKLSETVEYFDQNDELKVLTSATFYSYKPLFSSLVREKTETHPDGFQYRTTYKYPFDYFEVSNIIPSNAGTRLKALHMLYNTYRIDNPVETITAYKHSSELDFKTTGSSLNLYQINALTQHALLRELRVLKLETPLTTYVPAHVYDTSFVISSDFKRIKRNGVYDGFDNVLWEGKSDGTAYQYQWSDNNSLISSVTKNPGPDQHQMTYNHKALVGLILKTDQEGKQTFYEYDKLNRLRIIRDHNQNILKRYEYYYSTEDNLMPEGTLTNGVCKMINTSITFQGSVNTLHGQTMYTWNFGDGTIVTNTTGSASHTYTAAGYFTVTVSRSNPKYFGQTANSVQILVGSPITSASICAHGIVSYDVCSVIPPQINQCIGESLTTEKAVVTEKPKDIRQKGTKGVMLTTPGAPAQPPFLGLTINGVAVSYSWQYQYNGGSWITFSTSPTVIGPPGFGSGATGTWNVICTVTEACGDTFTTPSISLFAYDSNGCTDI